MRKIKMVAGLTVLACALLTGCGKKEEVTTTEATTEATTTEAATTEATTEATPEDAEEELPAIGEESADAIKVKLTNKTGKEITSVAIRTSADEEFGDNLLADEDTVADKEKRYLYYAPEKDAAETEDAAVDIQITFADDTSVVLHDVDLEDIKDGELAAEDDICYLSYKSVKTGKTVDTKDAELAVKQAEEEKAAADAKAAAEAAAAAAAQQQATEAPAPADNGGDDECLGDGLTY